jgi:hypothetical protein
VVLNALSPKEFTVALVSLTGVGNLLTNVRLGEKLVMAMKVIVKA